MVKTIKEAVRDGSLIFKPWLTQFSPERFEIDFSNVAAGRGNSDYLDPATFFELTYMTQRMKDVLQLSLARSAGLNDKAILYLATGFGGGKSHLLTLLYHVFKSRKVPLEGLLREIELDGVPSVKVVTVDGKNMAYPMTSDTDFGVYLKGTMESTIKAIEAKGKPVVFLIDELVIYLAKLDDTRREEEMAHLQTFISAVKATHTSLLMITNPSGTPVYGKTAENLENFIIQPRRDEASNLCPKPRISSLYILNG
jgi:hypothetical protein